MKIIFRLLLSFSILLLAGFCITQAASTDKPQKQKSVASPSFLFLSDIHLDTFDSTTAYGEDTGLELWKNFLAKTDSLLAAPNAPDFIVYTGDLPAHYPWSGSAFIPPADRGTHNANLKAILDGLRGLSDRYHKPLFYLPGNNDGLAGDYYSFADAQQLTPFSLSPDPSNPFPALNINSGNAAPCMVSNPHPTMGYYSACPVKGLRLIALNTVMYNHHFATDDGTSADTDRVEQMKWLANELADARDKGEKVYLAMHVPPGTDAYSDSPMWITDGSPLNKFLALTSQYQKTIAGILYGHTHMDEVRRLYDSTGTHITEVAISCPGVTPQHNNNPGFKIVQYDPKNMELLDFTTFYTTPGAASWGSSSYTFHSAFSCPAKISIYQRLSAMSFADVSASMSTIFMVKNGATPSYAAQGIEVKWAQ